MELVRSFDVEMLQGMSVGMFRLNYAAVTDVAQALEPLNSGAVAATSGSQSGARAAVPSPPPAAGDRASSTSRCIHGTQVMPIERLNSVLIVPPRASQLDQARRWIECLDQPSDSSTEPRLFIYQMRNGNARHLASLLAGLFGEGDLSASASVASYSAPTGLATSSIGAGNAPGGAADAWPFGGSGPAQGATGAMAGRTPQAGCSPSTRRSTPTPRPCPSPKPSPAPPASSCC